MSARRPHRAPPRAGQPLAHEIEPGRSVSANWDKALRETWAERKARLAAERSTLTVKETAS